MTTVSEAMKVGAQQALDELFTESLILFKLWVGVVQYVGMQEYIVRFHDSRYIRSMFPGHEARHSKQFFEPLFWIELRDLGFLPGSQELPRPPTIPLVTRLKHQAVPCRVLVAMLASIDGVQVPNSVGRRWYV